MPKSSRANMSAQKAPLAQPRGHSHHESDALSSLAAAATGRRLRAQLAEGGLVGLEGGADVAEAVEVGDAHELGQVEQDALLALVAGDADVAALRVPLQVAATAALGHD